jgi:hypothetical protein
MTSDCGSINHCDIPLEQDEMIWLQEQMGAVFIACGLEGDALD